VDGTATGKMTLHGVTRTITVPVQLAFLPQLEENKQVNDWLRISSTFKLKMSDYGIQLPEKVLGMRVNDELTIDFNTAAKAL
jgi:polyisoprenoid-binding protein YceI